MNISHSNKHWYALYTRPRWEKKVYYELVDRGISAYLPVIKTLKQWSDRKKMVEEPLFKSYIFVHVGPNEYYEALKTIGAVRYITFQGKPAAIPQQEIEAIKAYINEGDARIEYTDRYSVGDRVEIRFGAMKGLAGKLIDLQGKHRVLIEITGIGERLLLNIPKSYLYIQ
jgi:transcription antitermination factor NusG